MRSRLPGILAGLVFVLLGCSAPGTRPEPGTPDASELTPWRARLVAAALGEWRGWGRIVLDGWPEALPQEADPRLFSRVLAYWEAAPVEGPGIIRQHTHAHEAMMMALGENSGAPELLPSISLWAYPAWSAAFISYLMKQAQIPGFVFPPAAAHATYIDILLQRAITDPVRAAFRPHDPADYAPQPGDLLCADRSLAPLVHWQDRLAEAGQFRPMHCDLVVDARTNLVQAVGGNVVDVVALRRFPADGAGRVLPPPVDKPPFIVILENRLDAEP